MSGWRRRSAAVLAGLAIALPGCARDDRRQDESKAIAPQQSDAVGRAYFTLLSAEKCARRATDQQAVAIQYFRISRIVGRAGAEGLEQRLLDTRARWTRFDETADWACPTGDPLANLTRAVDAFDRQVTEALA